jgi:hypothetical protein
MAQIDKSIRSTRAAHPLSPSKSSASVASVDDVMPPVGRGFKSIPAPAVLQSLIDRAVAALHRGIYWDRGSIVNILV